MTTQRTIAAIALVSLCLAAAAAQAERTMEIQIAYPHAETDVIFTNLRGTGDTFSVVARALNDGVPVDAPDMQMIIQTNRCDNMDVGPYIPTSGPTEGGWYMWSDLRLPAGGVTTAAPDQPFIGILGGNASGTVEITVASPDLTGAYPGGDGVVNLSDIAVFVEAYNGAYNPLADFNGDGEFDLSDITLFATELGTTCGGDKVDLGDVDLMKLINGGSETEAMSFGGLKATYR